MASKMKSGKLAQKNSAEPKRSDNFKDMNVGDMTVSFRKETKRFTLMRGEEFLFSDQNLDSVLYTAKRKAV